MYLVEIMLYDGLGNNQNEWVYIKANKLSIRPTKKYENENENSKIDNGTNTLLKQG